jgi:methyl-accepting chemotaxis protein
MILEAKETLKRMTSESSWKAGIIGAIEEILSALPYIEHSVTELSKTSYATQSYAQVCEQIAKPLRTTVISAEFNARWNKIDPIQLTAFNSSMAKLMRLMVSVNSNAQELFGDMKNLFDINTGMQKYLKSIEKPKNSLQIKTAIEYLSAYNSSTISLIEAVNTVSQTINKTNAPDLLHADILRQSRENAGNDTTALQKLKKIIAERKKRSASMSPRRMSPGRMV